MEIQNWIIKKIKIKDLIANARNPRTITKEKFEKLKSSIESVGIFKPIICKHDGTILGGNQRHKAFLEQLPAEFEVYVSMPPYEMTNEQYDRVLLSDNVSAGAFDFDALANDFELEMIQELGIDLILNIDPIVPEGDDEEPPKKYLIEVKLANDMDQADLYDDLLSKGYLVKKK